MVPIPIPCGYSLAHRLTFLCPLPNPGHGTRDQVLAQSAQPFPPDTELSPGLGLNSRQGQSD